MENQEWFSLDMQSLLCCNVYAAGCDNEERATSISRIREDWISPSADAAWQAVLDEQQGLRMMQTAWSPEGCKCPNRKDVRPVHVRPGVWHTCRPLDRGAAARACRVIGTAKRRFKYHHDKVKHLG